MVRFSCTLNADSLPFILTSEWHNCTFISNCKVLFLHCTQPFFPEIPELEPHISEWIAMQILCSCEIFRKSSYSSFLKLCHGIYFISMLRGQRNNMPWKVGGRLFCANVAWDYFPFKAIAEGFLQSHETIKCIDFTLQICDPADALKSLDMHCAYRNRWRTLKNVSAFAPIKMSTEHSNQVMSPSLVELSEESNWSTLGFSFSL